METRRKARILKAGPQVLAAGFSPVTTKFIPIAEGAVRVETIGRDLDTGTEIPNISMMSDKEADDMALGMLDYGWQEVPVELR